MQTECKANLYKLSDPNLRGEMIRQNRGDEFKKVVALKKSKNIGKTKSKAKTR